MANLDLIITAIRARRVIAFNYKNIRRVVEPFLVGAHKDTGNDSLRAWMLSGTTSQSGSNWRMYTIDEISNIEILEASFSGSRPGFDRYDDAMRSIYLSV